MEPISTQITYAQFGDVISYILKTKEKYKKHATTDQSSTIPVSTIFEIKKLITEAFAEFNVDIVDKQTYTSQLLPGDILIINYAIPTWRVVTAVYKDRIATYPTLSETDKKKINGGVQSSYTILERPDLSKVNKTYIEEIIREIIPDTRETELNKQIETFKRFDTELLGDDVLQIGDLIFVVSPTQISFNTQNGYQYFPTVRTQGNPKMPTLQQVKNLAISLVFPNTDSINYQLLHLLAMFKRTPFVNIKNKDIVDFFKEISFGKGADSWIAVALESINVQSIDGFPNSLQAQITILPFDPRFISGGFQALRSLEDVKKQQGILFRNYDLDELIRKSNSKLIEETASITRLEDVISSSIEGTYDFRESLPFRAFYQSVIEDRTSVVDETGNPVPVVDANNTVLKDNYPIKDFRPIHPENRLRDYNPEDNNKQFEFSYNYIEGDFHSFSEELSDQRLEAQTNILKDLMQMYDLIKSPEDLLKQIIVAFHTRDDFYRTLEYKYNNINSILQTLLARHNIDIASVEGVQIKNLVDLLVKGLLQNTGVTPIVKATQQVYKTGKGAFDINEPDPLKFFDGLITNTSESDPVYGVDGTITAKKAAEVLYAWMDGNDDRRAKFSSFMLDLRQEILTDLTQEKVVIAAQQGDTTPFKVYTLPLKKETIVIDNSIDVIESWNMTYSNKFVPINLQAFKYPYYQHIGSDDINISFRITSTSSKKLEDLKTQLSALSEHLYENVKMITLNTPELMPYLDSRITVTAKDGERILNHSIFDMLGINKVTFNASSVSNINGSPGSWSIILNLTQSNFTLQKYHQVETIHTTDLAEEEVAKLIGRMRLVDNNRIIINKYFHKNEDGTVGDEITDFNLINAINFLDSPYGDKLSKHLASIQRKKQIGAELGYNLRSTAAIIRNEVLIREDNVRGSKLNTIALENPEFHNLLIYVLRRYDDVLKLETDALIQTVRIDKSWLDHFVDSFNRVSQSNTTNQVALGWSILTVGAILTGSALLFPITVTGGIFLTAIALNSVAGGFIGEGVDKIRNISSNFLKSIIDNYKKTALLEISRKIINDPVIRDTFLTKDIIGNDVLDAIENSQSRAYVNCYNDFDIPPLFGENSLVRLSPDFYLYNDLSSNFENINFINSAIERYARTGKLGMMMSLIEGEDAITKFDTIINTFNGAAKDEKITNNVRSVLKIKEADARTAIQEMRAMYLRLSRVNTTKEFEENIDAALSDKKIAEVVTQWEKANPAPVDIDTNNLTLDALTVTKRTDLVEWQRRREDFIETIKLSGNVLQNKDQLKLNLITAARAKTLVELYEIYSVLNEYMSARLNITDAQLFSKTKEKRKGKVLEILTKPGADLKGATDLQTYLKSVLENAESISSSSKEIKNIKALNIKDTDGLAFADNEYLTLPDMQKLQNYVYNKIGFYVRLNTFINETNSAGAVGDLETLPELKFLDWWNFRSVDENFRKLDLINQFMDSNVISRDVTSKLYPTFKLYFIEEDKGIIRNFDDFYSHNAIQSIEINSSKSRSSIVARLVLSNVTNTLTDRLSFFRERQDTLLKQDYAVDDNVFFGTLDIKPGTAVMIKLGYAANDKDLKTVFVGRIVEMNAGSNVTMICQSFGAQLQHKIIQEHFGMFSATKEFGDIASSILDDVPGLEKLGQTSPFDIGLSEFSGKNIRKQRGNIGQRLLMSNLLGSVSSFTFAQDNPRDENIYLKYSLMDQTWHKPTFDWIVYDQTVWEALEEMCLYHRNHVPIMRLYNNDPLTSKNHTRETLVIGDKSGYYKFTDAFSLTSIDIKKIREAVNSYNSIILPFLVALANGRESNFIYFNDIAVTEASPFNLTEEEGNYTVTDSGRKLWEFFQDKTNTLVFVSFLLKNSKIQVANDLMSVAGSMLGNNALISDEVKKCTQSLMEFIQSNPIEFDKAKRSTTSNIILFDSGNIKARAFSSLVHRLKKYFKKYPGMLIKSLIEQDYYNIKTVWNNTDESLFYNPQYKKIQRHHLVNDISDIISNNITLSTDFANTVNVYYFPEPKVGDLTRVNTALLNKLNIWPVKAFGDLRDDQVRVLNSYQKNIDTNWLDVTSKFDTAFKDFRRVHKNSKSEKDLVSYLKNGSNGPFSFDTPNWNAFPSFVIVGVNLLKKEISKMYTGSIEIAGNPEIQPLDIIHVEDFTNDMHGAVEVDEITHIFTPDGGYRTIIVPSMITYDRDPIQLQDVSIINDTYKFIDKRVAWGRAWNLFGFGLSAISSTAIGAAAGSVPGAIIGAGIGLTTGIPMLWNGTIGMINSRNKFIYDQMGNILGRDCINFTSLIYHGQPYMAGFDGVDYTNLKTLINHKIEDIQNPVSRFAAFSDPLGAALTTDYNPAEFGFKGLVDKFLFGHSMPEGQRLKMIFPFDIND